MSILRHTGMNSVVWAPDEGGVAAAASSGGGGSAPAAPSGASVSGAPAATPSPSSSQSPPDGGSAPSGTPKVEGADSFSVFDAFDNVFEGTADSSVPEATPEVVVPVALEAKVPAVDAAVPTPPVAPVAPAASEAPVATGDRPPLDLSNPEGMLATLQANEADIISMVAQEMFQLSSEDREALETDFASALPKLGAKIYVKSMQSAMAQVAKIVPALISKHLEQSKVGESLEQEFLSAWPQLTKAAHGAEIARTAKLVRALNPNATKDEVFSMVGQMVSVRNGLLQGGGAAVTAPAGTAPVVAKPAPPFAPAMNGGGSPNGRVVEANEWAGLSN